MTTAFKTAARGVWALGDYHRFAVATVWGLGPVLVGACGISAGQRVLDVAAGTGNVAIRAARAGAAVIASDLTPEHFEAGRAAARAEGVDLAWVEGDAEALPFEDAEFDVVTTCFGAMFAPDHRTVADELLRVCRPGGVVGMINFTAEGAGGEFFRMLAPYLPLPPAGALPPLLWGSEEHVRDLFGDRVESLELTRHEYVEEAASSRAYYELFRHSFGPMVAIYASLADRPDRAAALDQEFLAFVSRWNRGRPGRRIEIPYQYLLVIARTPGAGTP
jgi:2-polyprenyl-6-hydroxyphenyl methylase/3-demethylubiquinone-9 3-methyltransferase